ncbi:4'-phosphopantetheinyl transferase family protein [Actinomadura verrucosospora]|uniref:4'-phosphopantetheinyl transferase family protein n=1 Tax=Actinomadura verrucosospora TaxID=46165 RepID=UPI0024845979|nr:4'-phosphopantetheinyl transferase superfamily protein [Actinomadura verrucosospora]
MIESLLPPTVRSTETFDDIRPAHVFPEEEAVVAEAVPKRRREFATVRACAREALGLLGVPAAPILPGTRGAPGWPTGIVGSMTHCDGYRAAAVASDRDCVAIGVDAEPHGPLPDGVLEAVAIPPEQSRIAELTAVHPATHWDRLLFSAKESVYKAWFPLTGRPLGFEDAHVDFDPHDRRFTARLLVPGHALGDGRRVEGFEGRWLAGAELVITAIALSTPGAA